MITDYRSAIEEYLPDSQETERLNSITERAENEIERYCKESGINADAILVGSVAKGTNLKGADLDIFIRFNREYDKKEMETLGLDLGHKVLSDGQEKYAEHPYVTGSVEGVKLDIVPCYKILPGQKKVSSVDRTPLHTEYVKKNLPDDHILDVLLLKVFTKSIGVYGSEVTISGFSGYICEILVIEYGSFEAVLRAFSGWKGKFTLGKKSSVSRFNEPVVIIDPVDEDRNAAAAISLDNLSRMKLASRMFLRTKDERFLNIERHAGKANRAERGTALRIFSVPRPDMIDDVIYPQAVRFRHSVWSLLDREGFDPLDSEVEVSDRVRVLIECRTDVPPVLIMHRGPPVDSDNVLEFIESWRNRDTLRGPYIRGDRLYVDIRDGKRTIENTIRENIGPLNIGKSLNRYKNEIKIETPDITDKDPLLEKFLSRGLF